MHDHHFHDHHDHCHSHEHEHFHAPLDELMALMKYMTGHNAAHAKELADLAHQLAHAGSDAAYDKVMAAVSKFDEGNAILAAVLSELEAK